MGFFLLYHERAPKLMSKKPPAVDFPRQINLHLLSLLTEDLYHRIEYHLAIYPQNSSD